MKGLRFQSLHCKSVIERCAVGSVSLLLLIGLPSLSVFAQNGIQTIKLSASDPDGKDTETARLGVSVTLAAAVSDGADHDVTWEVSGGGSIQRSSKAPFATATYTPPKSMPSSANVGITAYLTNATKVKASYDLKLINPVPTVSGVTPAKLLTGGTQKVTLAGTGFVSGTTVSFDGKSLSTTYSNYNTVTVDVPVPATATGSLSLQVNNPTPGGGSGSKFTETVESNSIALTAKDNDGEDTGTAGLGVKVTMSAAVTGSEAKSVVWSLDGSGSISSSGVYTAPSTMPSDPAVKIKANLASNPAVTSSYTLNLINPIPAIVSANEYVVSNVETNTISLKGTGFVADTLVTANNATVTTTYQSSTSLQLQITVSPGTTGTIALQATNPLPGGGTSSPLTEAISSNISATAAARLLDQTTFGPTPTLIKTVQDLGVNGWITQQLNTPPTLMAALSHPYPAGCAEAIPCAESEWWEGAITGNDQLRQRVAFALSQIFVISTASVLGNAMPQYQNVLLKDAFTNWFQIMRDITKNPGMGIYLNMAQSAAAASGSGQIANENYARENMQLFNMGLYLLNQDGSMKLDANGNSIPSYTEAQVQAFARVFTGWTFTNADGSKPPWLGVTPNYSHTMVAVESFHDKNPKNLLNDQDPTDYTHGTTLASGQTAEDDLFNGLHNVFMHPNVAPFVSQLLIQHLVTSNPSPAYVSRVASVFINNGSNVRGDMKAVITAILTDSEARYADTHTPKSGAGHLREPILWMTGVVRGLGDINIDPNDNYIFLSYYSNYLNERPFQSPDVFNFFPPNYIIPGLYTSGAALTAPEFGIEDSGTVIERDNVADTILGNYLTGFNIDLSSTSSLGKLAASDPGAMVDQLGLIFMHAQMSSSIRSAIVDEISSVSSTKTKVMIAAYLVITSSAYKIVV